MTTIKLHKNYFSQGNNFLEYSIGEDAYGGMGWKENQIQEMVLKFNLPEEFLSEEKIEISDTTMSEMHKLWNSFKTYHLIDNGSDLKIAYPGDMQIKLVEALEKARKNVSFVVLSSGNMKTGEAWGDLYDVKGRIGLSRGKDYLFPILVSFKRGEYDEEMNETFGESYDFLSDCNSKDIDDYLDSHKLNLDDVLDNGGGTITSVVAVQSGLKKTTLLYRHQNFTPSKDFNDVRVDTETFTTVCTVKSDKSEEVKETKKVSKKFVLYVEGEIYSRHDSKEDLNRFLRANKQINLTSKGSKNV